MADKGDTDVLLDATTALLPPLLTALEALAQTARRLHPPDLPALVAATDDFQAPLAAGLQQFDQVVWPEHLQYFVACSRDSASRALESLGMLGTCLEHENPFGRAYRALRAATSAVEALYPVAFMLPPVNRFFLTGDRRQDEFLQRRLIDADVEREDVGVMHADNGLEQRGGFSLYVPEYYDNATPAPLVVALHGGSGHGRRFLWSWLTEARSRGAILLAPTARQETWSLMGPDVDTENLLAAVEHIGTHWNIDRSRMLLTGMSDGGTFAYLSGLREDSPFTHLAPVASTFHPILAEVAAAGRLAGLPIYLVHGALDWMFPVDVARSARDTLAAAGAAVTYRELADLSHTYPREENVRILDWVDSVPR